MTDEQKCKLNAVLCEALEPKPVRSRSHRSGGTSLLTDWWEFTGDPLVGAISFGWEPRYDLFADGNAMLKLIKAMRERRWRLIVQDSSANSPLGLVFYKESDTTKNWWSRGESHSLPEATSLAACRALGLEVPE
jgi:hypothetical protein